MEKILDLLKKMIPEVESIEVYEMKSQNNKRYFGLNQIGVLEESDVTDDLFEILDELYQESTKVIKFQTHNEGHAYLKAVSDLDFPGQKEVIIFYPDEELDFSKIVKE